MGVGVQATTVIGREMESGPVLPAKLKEALLGNVPLEAVMVPVKTKG